jgi:ubiquinol-cytochrome c reductase cytochrome b subunit
MFSRVVHWINDRWPLSAMMRLGLEEEMPGGDSFGYIFGSSVLATFLIQVITGLWQLFYFVPTINHGYDSLNYLRLEIPFGWLIHGLHYWGAAGMIILVGLHMSRVFLWGAYKNPRQLTWLIGVGLLITTLALGFTGPVLPWDQRGYWEIEVGTSMAGTVPYLGDLAKHLLRGGPSLGQMTLSRVFVLHVAILPGVVLILILLHMVAFRQFGISGPWKQEKRKIIGRFWPDQVFKDTVVITFLFVILVGLAAYIRPPIAGPKNPMDTSYIPKPEWYFLFLYQTLKAFPGRLEPIGTVGIPLFITLLLVFLPFIDRNPEQNPRRRPITMSGYVLFVAWVIIVAFIGYFSKPETASSQTPSSQTITSTQISESGPKGAQLFHSLGCIGCHRVKGQGGTVGPELSSESLKGKSRPWLITQIRDPKKHDPNTIMPAFASASDQQVNELVDYLQSLASSKSSSTVPSMPQLATMTVQKKLIVGPHGQTGPAANVIGSVDRGTILFQQHCEACHGSKGTDKVPNPGSEDGTVPPLHPIDPELFSKDPQIFVDNIDLFIQHGSRPEGPNPALQMLPFGDSNSLNQQTIANVEAYILWLNGVDRAKLVRPSLQPHLFFWLVLIIFAVVIGGLWILKGMKGKGKPSRIDTKEESPSPNALGSTRRSFLKVMIGGLSALITLAIGIPFIGNLIGPSFQRRRLTWTKVGDLRSLTIGQPLNLDFSFDTQDAYLKETVMHSVWVIKRSSSGVTEMTVYSPICPHLGCRYDWDPQSKTFVCPCHGSVYSIDGKVLGGPAPRPLDTLPFKVENGMLYIQWEEFKVGVPEKIPV